MDQKISPALIIVPALGLGVLGVLGIAYFARAAPPEPEPGTVVTVALKHPPPEATMWQLVLTDWDITIPIHQIGGMERLDIAEPIAFEIPSEEQFPLRIISLQITKWNEARTALIVLYEVQSFRPYLWDWDLEDYGTELDPSYRDGAFITSHGNYFFNVATAQFELMGIAKPLELQAVP